MNKKYLKKNKADEEKEKLRATKPEKIFGGTN